MRTFTTTSLTSFNVSFHMHFGQVLAVPFQIMLLLPCAALADLKYILAIRINGAATEHLLFLAHTINSFETNSVDCHNEKSLFYMIKIYTCTANSHIESTQHSACISFMLRFNVEYGLCARISFFYFFARLIYNFRVINNGQS